MRLRLAFPTLGLGLSLTALGCAVEDGLDEPCQPGDIDCAPDDGDGGKADGWGDGVNDPARMSNRLQYRLADLPKKGALKTPVWARAYPDAVGRAAVAWSSTYWPTAQGSHNHRWQGPSVQSPLEKYDRAFNNAPGCATHPASTHGDGAKAAWDAYDSCAGPAAKWQTSMFQGARVMHDGLDNDGDGKIDNRGPDGIDGIADWWGTCHAWSPAALVVPEPQQPVEVNGVVFDIGDLHALIQNAYDGTAAVMLGGRCNAKEIPSGPTASANHACLDVNPGALHVVLTNFLGIYQLPLIEDRTANYEVWNQPVVGYEVLKQAKISAKNANACVGSSGSKWTYNSDAKELYEVRTRVSYVVEGQASREPLGFEDYTRTDTYHYILELSSGGKVLGGRYCTDSDNTHIDFLWSPTGNHNPSNPHVSVARVKELIAKSVARPGGSGGTGKTFTVTPHAVIGDNDPAGVTANVVTSGLSGSLSLAVSVDITHTYRGDLVVELLYNGGKVKVLQQNLGGALKDLVQTYTLTPAEVGTKLNGTWAVRVIDTAVLDGGVLNKVTLEFR